MKLQTQNEGKCLRTKIIYVTFLNVLILGIVHIFLPPLLSAAQKNKITFNHLSVEHGLSQVTIYCMLQDKKGFMWFGTEDGLNKYDGYTFTIYKYDPENPKSLGGNTIHALHEDRAGMIWIGTDGGGLNKFDPVTEQFTRYQHNPDDPHSLSSDSVWEIREGQDGALWIGTYWGGGLDKFDRKTEEFTHYIPNPDDPNSLWVGEGIEAIYEDNDGVLWIGTAGGGLNKFDRDTETFTHYINNPDDPRSLSHNTIMAICEDQMGMFWIATAGGGLNRFDRTTEQFTHYQYDSDNPQSLSQDPLREIYEDSTGVLWIGTDTLGLDIFDRETKQFVHYQPDPADPRSLSDGTILSIYEDRAGVLWFGTALGGLNTYDRTAKKFDVYRTDPDNPQSLSSSGIKAVCQGRNDMVWISAGARLNKLNRKTGQVTRYLPPETDLVGIMTIYEDQAGMLWLGTWNFGLKKFNPETHQITTYLTDPEDLQTWSANVVMTIYETPSEEFWAGTFAGGLARFDRETEQFTWYRHDPDDPNSLSHNLILAMYEDLAGTLWIGTGGGGLNKFERETGQFTSYRHDPESPHSLSHNNVVAIHEDQSGTFWIATADGLNKFDRTTETFTRYTEKNGLPHNSIAALLEDKQGNLWISATRGLSKFDPRTGIFRNYDIRDGLQSYEFNRAAAWKCRDGEMFFGGVNGLNAFYPNEVKDNPYIPPVVLTDFRILNKSVEVSENSPLKQALEETKTLQLSYNDYVFSLEFAALHYSTPEKNCYAYMLEGFDKDWNMIGTRRVATYTNLPADQYTFRVKGTNSDGIWNEEGTSIEIIMAPPWWETTWFRILMIIAVVAVVIGGYRWRVRAVEARSRKLERQVAARTEELSESNRQLEIAKEAALEAKTEAEVASQAKSTFITNMSHELRTPLNAILGYTQLLKREGMSMDSQYDAVDTIHRSGEHLLLMINELLDLSRIEARKIELKPTHVHLPGFLKSISEMIRIQAQKKGIAFHTDISAEIPKVILADEKRLRQILLNLLNNAVKFTEEGTVSLRVYELNELNELGELDESKTQKLKNSKTQKLHFEVSDTGIGIPPDQLQNIFLPFHRIANAHTEREGTGLGLAISQQLVRLMDSELQVKSVVGQGTTFWFDVKFPELIPDEAEEGKKEVAGITPHRIIGFKGDKRKILLVDDNAENRTLLRDTLAPLGFDIIEASNGHEALHIVRESPLDLILMDLFMPDLDGFEATRQIRQIPQLADVSVIGVSASVSSQVQQESLAAGCNDFLTKPIHITELLDRLCYHLGLEWIYEDIAGADEKQQLSEAAPLIIPPQETLLTLLESAKGGRITDIRKSIKTMKESDHNLIPFADRIRQLVKDYQFEQIIELIESSLKGEE